MQNLHSHLSVQMQLFYVESPMVIKTMRTVKVHHDIATHYTDDMCVISGQYLLGGWGLPQCIKWLTPWRSPKMVGTQF